MNQPLVSICIPAYNAGKTIAETLNSLCKQTYENIEIHVLDNVSMDCTRKIVKQFNRVHLHVNQKNIGGEPNIKKCRYLGSGKYKAIYHADDVYELDMVERAVDVLEKNKDIGAILTGAEIINANGRIIGRTKTFSQLGLTDKYLHKFDLLTLFKLVLRHYNFLICPSLMARADILESIESCPGADLDLKGNDVADLDLWFRIAKNYGLGLLNKQLIQYRRSKQQISYKLHTLRTFRSDFFKTIDYWIGQSEIKKHLSSEDFGWYEEQIRRDNLQCSARALIKGDKKLSRKLLKKSLDVKSFYYGLQSKTGMKFLLLLLFMCVISLPGFSSILRPFLYKMLDR